MWLNGFASSAVVAVRRCTRPPTSSSTAVVSISKIRTSAFYHWPSIFFIKLYVSDITRRGGYMLYTYLDLNVWFGSVIRR